MPGTKAGGLPMDGTTRGRVTRREALRRGAALAAVPLAVAAAGGANPAAAGEAPGLAPGLIPREEKPLNLESPFAALDGPLTPTERFFVRNHFNIPEFEPKTWRLRVEGAVERPLELTYDDLLALPATTAAATLECAGNNRVFLVPKAKGANWGLGAVSTAEWTGVPLAAVLERAGVRPGAVEVILEGADRGRIDDEPKSPGEIPFARSLPLAVATRPEVLLAHKMNGAPLPRPHGHPVRAVVPGWYGVASIKWLARIVVTDRPFRGFFQTLDYAYFDRRHGLADLVPITEMQVKAQVARPVRDEVIPRGAAYRVFGAAWSGDSAVARVEVSTDGGKSWADARLLGDPVPHSWRLWEHPWQAPGRAGRVTLLARATDRLGRTQPATRDPDRRTYLINHVLPIEVEIR